MLLTLDFSPCDNLVLHPTPTNNTYGFIVGYYPQLRASFSFPVGTSFKFGFHQQLIAIRAFSACFPPTIFSSPVSLSASPLPAPHVLTLLAPCLYFFRSTTSKFGFQHLIAIRALASYHFHSPFTSIHIHFNGIRGIDTPKPEGYNALTGVNSKAPHATGSAGMSYLNPKALLR